MATIAEKSRTKEIIDRLQGIINNASAVPLSPGKISVFKEEIQSLLTELGIQMEIELKTYHEVNDRKGKIISEAKKEAEKIIYQAEHSASRMRVSRHTTDVAPLDYDTLNEEERSALGNANEIYGASLIYTDEMLTEVTELISDAYHNIRDDYEIILNTLEEKLNVINNNRVELMDGLQEMDTEDRSQQILEIGQLLSSELHMSRMKARMNSDEYEDGSIQLSLDLKEEQEEKTRLAEESARRAAEALAEVTAERDALMETVEKMKKSGMREVVRGTKTAGVPNQAVPAFVKMMEAAKEEEAEEITPADEEVEYEIVYVSEDELEEGEEYEIEYVDDEEDIGYETGNANSAEEAIEYEIEYVNEEDLEEGEEYEIEYVDDEEEEQQQAEAVQTLTEKSDAAKTDEKNIAEKNEDNEETVEKQVKKEKTVEDKNDQNPEAEEAIRELEGLEKENEKIPIIPHFKKSETVASVPAEKVSRMAKAITTEEKYSGLISRAVMEREKAEAAVTVEQVETLSDKNLKDNDIRTDADGKEYIQAAMQFDEDFEIMEF